MKKKTAITISNARTFLWNELNRSVLADQKLSLEHDRIIPRWYMSVVETLNYFSRAPVDLQEREQILRHFERYSNDHIDEIRYAGEGTSLLFGSGICNLEINELLWEAIWGASAKSLNSLWLNVCVPVEKFQRDNIVNIGFQSAINTLASEFRACLATQHTISSIDRLWIASRLPWVCRSLRQPLNDLVLHFSELLATRPYFAERWDLGDNGNENIIEFPSVACTAKFGSAALKMTVNEETLVRLINTAEWMLSIQNPEGFWEDPRTKNLTNPRWNRVQFQVAPESYVQHDSILVTAQVLGFLGAIHPRGCESALEAATDWLIRQQRSDGSWESPDFLAASRHMPITVSFETAIDPHWTIMMDSENEWLASRRPFVTVTCVEALQQQPLFVTRPDVFVQLLPKNIRNSPLLACSPEVWLTQFRGADRELALILAAQLKLYTNRDVRDLFRRMFRELLLKDDRDRACFVGLGVHPGQSGPHLIGLLQQAIALKNPRERLLTVVDLHRHGEQQLVKVVVFVDDFIGNGTQAARYLSEIIECDKWLTKYKLYYLALVGFSCGVEQIKRRVPEFFRVDVVEKLSDVDRAFDSASPIFKTNHERARAKAMALKLGIRVLPNIPEYDPRERHALGWENSQALIAFEHNTPNNTLPIIWGTGIYRGKPWKPLLARYQKELSQQG